MSDFVIETRGLTKVYGEQTAVNSVNLHVRAGRIYGLLGRNGAGKTTIMKMILGLRRITSGEVDVFGQNIKGREKQIYPRIGAIIENPGFYPNLTGTENLKIFAEMRGIYHHNAVKSALEVVGLPYRDKKLFDIGPSSVSTIFCVIYLLIYAVAFGWIICNRFRKWDN